MKKQRAEDISRGIKIVWESLYSHLEGTYLVTSTGKKYLAEVGGTGFHKKCVKEYVELIKILTNLY